MKAIFLEDPVDVSVIVVHWNTADVAAACLRTIRRELTTVSGECLIIDNASDDGQVIRLHAAAPHADILCNPRNVGFAAAANEGISRTRGRYVVLLNPDAWLEAGTLRHLVDYMDSRPEVGAVGPLVWNVDGTVQGSARGFPGLTTAFFGRSSVLTRLFPRSALSRRNVPALGSTLRPPMPADWISGACVMIRREAWEQVGGFDEQFFMYWEDADLCWRLREAGWQIVYDPRVSVVHLVGAASERAWLRCTVAFHRSAYRVYRKHVTRHRWHPLNAVAAVGLTLRAMTLVVGRGARRIGRRRGLASPEARLAAWRSPGWPSPHRALRNGEQG